MSRVYFAYGTLLDIEAMRGTCPSAQPEGVMRLVDYRLGFATCAKDTNHGGCTLDAAPGEEIYGQFYRVPDEEMARLDEAAGVLSGLWDVIDITLINERGQEVPGSTYTIGDSAGGWPPPDSYVAPIKKGARALGLPTEYIAKLDQIIERAQAS